MSDPSTDDAGTIGRQGWLRAAVLGADDGIVSTASLLVGLAAGGAEAKVLLTAGVAGLVAGAASMAAGEYVSVSSQRDLEEALIARQEEEIRDQPDVELLHLSTVIEERGVEPLLARRVASQLMIADPVGAVARVRYGLSDFTRARPLQAALASAAAFSIGAAIPLGAVVADDPAWRMPLVVGLALLALTICGALGAEAGGASRTRAALRVVVGGGLAMALSAAVGRLVGVAL